MTINNVFNALILTTSQTNAEWAQAIASVVQMIFMIISVIVAIISLLIAYKVYKRHVKKDNIYHKISWEPEGKRIKDKVEIGVNNASNELARGMIIFYPPQFAICNGNKISIIEKNLKTLSDLHSFLLNNCVNFESLSQTQLYKDINSQFYIKGFNKIKPIILNLNIFKDAFRYGLSHVDVNFANIKDTNIKIIILPFYEIEHNSIKFLVINYEGIYKKCDYYPFSGIKRNPGPVHNWLYISHR